MEHILHRRDAQGPKRSKRKEEKQGPEASISMKMFLPLQDRELVERQNSFMNRASNRRPKRNKRERRHGGGKLWKEFNDGSLHNSCPTSGINLEEELEVEERKRRSRESNFLLL